MTLGPLTVLLGFNAAGKSNFLDALRFVADALARSPAQAVTDRGGLDRLLHRDSSGTADSFEVELELALRLPALNSPVTARYGLEIGRDPAGDAPLRVWREASQLDLPDGTVSLPREARAPQSRLRLADSATEPASPLAVLARRLASMRFYDLDKTALAASHEGRRHEDHSLGPAGEHLGHVLGDIDREDTAERERLDAYLSALVPGAVGVGERRSTVPQMSRGTLRAVGVLAALSQVPVRRGQVALVGIEAPETGLHPAGLGALYEALDDASQRTQVIATSRSSDLLGSEYARPEHVRVVSNAGAATRIGEIDTGGRSILDKGLMTLAELHHSGLMAGREVESLCS